MFLIICLISADKYQNFKQILIHIHYYTYLDIVDVMVVQIQKLTQFHANWVTSWESVILSMCSKVLFDLVPSYVQVMYLLLEVFQIVGYFLDRTYIDENEFVSCLPFVKWSKYILIRFLYKVSVKPSMIF